MWPLTVRLALEIFGIRSLARCAPRPPIKGVGVPPREAALSYFLIANPWLLSSFDFGLPQFAACVVWCSTAEFAGKALHTLGCLIIFTSLCGCLLVYSILLFFSTQYGVD